MRAWTDWPSERSSSAVHCVQRGPVQDPADENEAPARLRPPRRGRPALARPGGPPVGETFLTLTLRQLLWSQAWPDRPAGDGYGGGHGLVDRGGGPHVGRDLAALRHYDLIGLLAPASVGGNGYRYYELEQLLRLQQILTLRELGIGGWGRSPRRSAPGRTPWPRCAGTATGWSPNATGWASWPGPWPAPGTR